MTTLMDKYLANKARKAEINHKKTLRKVAVYNAKQEKEKGLYYGGAGVRFLVHDTIPKEEWQHGAVCKYTKLLVEKLTTNSIMSQDLLDHFVQLHRFTFLDCEYDFTRERKIIEDLFAKSLNVEVSELANMENFKVTLHYKHRDLLVMFIKAVFENIESITSRKVYSDVTHNMIVNHLCYCKLSGCLVERFIDRLEITRVMELMELTSSVKEIAKRAFLATRNLNVDDVVVELKKVG